ncbi:MAG: hypothetical protein RR838_07295 [Clostridium sp.]
MKIGSRLIIVISLFISIAGFFMPWFFYKGYEEFKLGIDCINIGIIFGYVVILPSQFVRNRSKDLEMFNLIWVVVTIISVLYNLLLWVPKSMIKSGLLEAFMFTINYGFIVTLGSLLIVLSVYIFNYIVKRI